MRRSLARLLNFLKPERAEQAMSREMASHLALLEEDFLKRGCTEAEARREARLAYGSLENIKELHREARTVPLLEEFRKDLHYGLRGLLRAPGFTVTAVLTLALGIGANTAIFTVLNAVLLQPLPYRDADRLVTLLHDGTDPVAAANFHDWQEGSRSFEMLGAAEGWGPNHTGPESAEHLVALRLTQNLLSSLGVQPVLGRLFAPGEDNAGADHVAILSHRLWQRRFAGDRSIIGREITLDKQGYTVVGVMPADFKFAPFWATKAELWAPLALGNRMGNRGGNSLRIFGRLKPGVPFATARAEMASITARLERRYPGTNRNVVMTPLKQNVVGNVETPMLMIAVAVGFVLLIVCANVSHMLLARTADRQKEIALRLALGASRARVLKQLLTENLLLALAGALVGLPLALSSLKALLWIGPEYIPRVEMSTFNGTAIFFLCALTILAAVMFGAVPSWQAARGDVNESLKEGGRSGGSSARGSRLRSYLVASEFALAFTLLIGAGLMIRSFAALAASDPGFRPDRIFSAVVSVAGTREGEPGNREIFYRQLLERAKALPNVSSAGAINHLPLAGDMWGYSIEVEGRPKPKPGQSLNAVYRTVMPGYFETMRLPILQGRGILEIDDRRSPDVVLINARAAAAFWPGQNPIGQRITFDSSKGAQTRWATVIGIAANAKQRDWALSPYPEVYSAALQDRGFLGEGDSHSAYITMVLRSNGDPAGLASAFKQLVQSIDKNLPVSEIATMSQVVKDATAGPRFEMLLLTSLAALALVLAAVGIYGVMSYSLSRRKREIGIRMSLGAGQAQVLRMVLVGGMKQAAMGSVIGLAAALLLSKFIAKLLYGIQPSDPLTFGVVTAVLALAALLAICVPARRAVRIDPSVALREE